MYQASNAGSTNRTNFINFNGEQHYIQEYNEDNSVNLFQNQLVEGNYNHEDDDIIRQQQQLDDQNDSISFVLEEIEAALNGKDFTDLGDQKPECNIIEHQQQYQQQRYLVSNNNLISNKQVFNASGDQAINQQLNNNDCNQIKQQTTGVAEAVKVNSFYDNVKVGIVGENTSMLQDYQQINNNNNDINLNIKNHQDYTTMNNMSLNRRPYVEIVEQPAKCALRFRYKCEGRSAGSLPGVNSTADNKTYPSIRINNYVGRAVVVISCVTKDLPYKSHPHNIVGKEGCKKGICTIVVNNEENMVRSFASLGIQCVKRKDIEESLSMRESIKVDPFRNGFDHKLNATNIDLNVVRLCFQVFITGSTPSKCDVPLTPVVSEPIHDKKAMSDLVITKLSHCSAPATGGREVILLCDRISKDDIQIRFYEERDNKVVWETFTELSPTDVHKQVAICFRTPKYHNENITQPVMARIQLKRLSDNQVSEPRLFQFLPCESDEDIISRKRQKIELFNMNHYALDNILQPNNHQQQQHAILNRSQTTNYHNQQNQHSHHPNPHPHNTPIQPQLPVPQQQQQNAQACMIATPQMVGGDNNNRLGEGSPTPLQARRTSPSVLRTNQQLHEPFRANNPTSSRPPTRSPQQTPSPTQQHQHQQYQQHQNNFMIDNQNLVVRREIIDNEGRVMQLVDRSTDSVSPQQNNQTAGNHMINTTNNNTNRPLDSSLDRIHISELMPDMAGFNQNLDLNLGLSLSMQLNNGNNGAGS